MVSAWIRAAIKWVFFLGAVLIFLWIGWVVVLTLSESFSRQRAQELTFGLLDPPLTTKTFSKFSAKNYDLEASLPKNPTKARVFQFETNHISEKTLREIPSFFNLRTGQQSQTDGVTKWKSQTGGTLILNSPLGHFSFKSDFAADKTIRTTKISILETQAIKRGVEILKKLGLEAKDIDLENPTLSFYSTTNGSLQSSLLETGNAVEIKYYRKISGLTSVGDPPIRILLSGDGSKVLEFDYFYSPISDLNAFYPVLNAADAYAQVEKGGAYSQENKLPSSVRITHVNLSYSESRFYQPYLQPVWVFSALGDLRTDKDKIQLLVPAIDPKYFAGQ